MTHAVMPRISLARLDICASMLGEAMGRHVPEVRTRLDVISDIHRNSEGIQRAGCR